MLQSFFASPIGRVLVPVAAVFELSDAQVSGFIAAQKDLQPLSAKLLEGGDKPDDALKGELDGIAKKHGFQSFMDMETVGANISLVLDGLDRKTGSYTDPVEKMKQELENIKADASIPDDDKKLVVEDLLTVEGAGESQPEDGAPPAGGAAKPDEKK
jgi:hypothetical protein